MAIPRAQRIENHAGQSTISEKHGLDVLKSRSPLLQPEIPQVGRCDNIS